LLAGCEPNSQDEPSAVALLGDVLVPPVLLLYGHPMLLAALEDA